MTSYMLGTDILGAKSIDTVVPVSRDQELSMREAAARFLLDRLGTPYIWGGRDPSYGLDCSGAVDVAMEAAGIVPKGHAVRFAADDLERSLESISKGDLQVGDLVFYGSRLKPGATHVMMYVGEGKVVGATGGGRNSTSPQIAREQDAAVKVKNLDYRKDIRGYGRLPIGKPLNYVKPSFWWTLTGGMAAAALLGGGIYLYTSRGRKVAPVVPF